MTVHREHSTRLGVVRREECVVVEQQALTRQLDLHAIKLTPAVSSNIEEVITFLSSRSSRVSALVGGGASLGSYSHMNDIKRQWRCFQE